MSLGTMTIGKHFKETLRANLANSRWSWGAFNPLTNTLFLRVWQDNITEIDGKTYISVLNEDWTGNSPGFPERIRHVASLKNGTKGYGVICVARSTEPNTSRSIKEFDQNNLAEFGEILQVGNVVYAEITATIPVEEISRHRTGASTILPDLKTILNSKIETTQKEMLGYARIGQGHFRSTVLQAWDNACCVTGVGLAVVLRASHIKPWRDSDNAERLDPNNGLPLIANLDALFDRGLISFAEDGELLVSKSIGENHRKDLNLDHRGLRSSPPVAMLPYLEYHRDNIFQENAT